MRTRKNTSRTPRSLRTLITRVVLGIVVVLLVTYISISVVVANNLTIPPRGALIGDPLSTAGMDYEDITFPSRIDAITISAWFIPNHASDKALIFIHGKGQNRTLEFNNQALSFCAALQQHGFNVLMLDLRGHGKSGKSRFTYGIRERRDIEGAVDWLRAHGFEDGSIGVIGVSLGAASSIGAAADEPAIGALVADSSYAELYPIVQRAFTSESGLPDFFLPSTFLAVSLIVGEDISTSRPVREIGAIAPRPVLIIHAQEDTLIPVSHAHQLADALPNSDLWIVDEAYHAKAFNKNPDEYINRVTTFFDQSLSF